MMLIEGQTAIKDDGLKIDKNADHTYEEKTAHFKSYGLKSPVLADSD